MNVFMKKKVALLSLILLLASCGDDKAANLSTDNRYEISVSNSSVAVQAVLSHMEEGIYREGELLVKFRPGVVASSTSRTHQAFGAVALKNFAIVPNLDHVKLPEGLPIQEAVKKYMSDPTVEYAEPNYVKHASFTFTNPDPFFGQQWALQNTGQFNGTAGADIKALQAWDITTGNNSVIVAVIDTGIDPSHPDLSRNVISGFNFLDNSKPPLDDNGHGTYVAGIIGAVGNNGTGIAGVIWNVQLMPLKFLDVTGSGTEADEIAAIGFAVAHGAKIINASFSGAAFAQAEQDAIASANNAGVLFITAAGNGGGPFCDNSVANNNDGTVKCYPASYALPNIISVAATDENDQKASFSNFGQNSVHVAAPGVHILSTVPLSVTQPFCEGSFAAGYEFCSGTSSAAPHVSGLAGLLYSYAPSFTSSQIRAAILSNVDVLPTLNGLILSGGRINAFKALSSATVPKSGGGGGGGGGCSIGARQNAPTEMADCGVMLTPLLVVVAGKRFRRLRNKGSVNYT